MADAATQFLSHVQELFATIHNRSGDSLEQAADMLVDTIVEDGLIHIGAAGGHSQLPTMEMFYRAGGLANVNIIFGCGLGLFDASPCLERMEGMGRMTMAHYDVRPRDTVIIVSLYGINAATIDLALAAKERARRVIGITSTAFSRQTPPDFVARHSSGKNLVDVVDLVVDTWSDPREQLIPVPGVSEPVGVASSLAGIFTVQLLVMKTAEAGARRGVEVPLWRCGNVPGGDDTNLELLRRYIPRVRHLYPEAVDYSGA